jgi:hypothetical protein
MLVLENVGKITEDCIYRTVPGTFTLPTACNMFNGCEIFCLFILVQVQVLPVVEFSVVLYQYLYTMVTIIFGVLI